MNKRARNRLIGVTAIILLATAAVFFGSGAWKGSYSRTVQQATSDPALIGKRIKVKGPVVAGSWDKRMNPMKFRVGTEGKPTGAELSVVYSGAAPNTFGDGVVAILTGTLEKGGVLKADDMTTVCPDKYSTKSQAYTVTELLKRTQPVPFVRVYGYLKPQSLKASGGSAERFVLTSSKSGGGEIRVMWDKVMPAGTADGVQLVAGGRYDGAGVLAASEVAQLATGN